MWLCAASERPGVVLGVAEESDPLKRVGVAFGKAHGLTRSSRSGNGALRVSLWAAFRQCSVRAGEKKITRPLECQIVQCFTEPKVSEKKKIAEKIKEKEKLQKKKQEELKKRVTPYFCHVSENLEGRFDLGFSEVEQDL